MLKGTVWKSTPAQPPGLRHHKDDTGWTRTVQGPHDEHIGPHETSSSKKQLVATTYFLKLSTLVPAYSQAAARLPRPALPPSALRPHLRLLSVPQLLLPQLSVRQLQLPRQRQPSVAARRLSGSPRQVRQLPYLHTVPIPLIKPSASH